MKYNKLFICLINLFILSNCTIDKYRLQTYLFIVDEENYKNHDKVLNNILSLQGIETICDKIPSLESKIIVVKDNRIAIQNIYHYNFFEKFASSKPTLTRFRDGYTKLDPFVFEISIDTIDEIISDRNPYIISLTDNNKYHNPKLVSEVNFTSKDILQLLCAASDSFDIVLIDLSGRTVDSKLKDSKLLEIELVQQDPFKLLVNGLPDGQYELEITENGITDTYTSLSQQNELIIVFDNINWSIPTISILKIKDISNNKIIPFILKNN